MHGLARRRLAERLRGFLRSFGFAAACLALAACRLPDPFTAGLFTRSAGRPTPTAADCERCHQEVYREWRASLHAHAWTSEDFQRAAAGGRADECTGCHAAAPVSADVAPALRQLHVAEGVTCVTCHLSPDPAAPPLAMRGPESRTSPVQIHPVIERDPLYRASELCGSCHTGAYEEWRAASDPPQGEKQTCQGCHMPSVRRTMESVHDEHAYSAIFVALGAERELRRHDFAVPRLEAIEGLRVELASAPGGAAIARVANELPHALPTGRFGRRELRLVASWPGGRAERQWVRSLGQAIEAGAVLEMELPVPRDERGGVRLRLERWDHAAQDWSPLAEANAPGP